MPKLKVFENGGGIFMQSPQIPDETEEKGFAHIRHEAPVYSVMVDQQERQKGATKRLSVRQEQAGQVEG